MRQHKGIFQESKPPPAPTADAPGPAEAVPATGTLTQEALEVPRAAVLRPVRVLEVPDRPLLPCEQVLHLQARGGVAAGVRAEARGDLEPPVGDGVVPGAQPRPVPETLLPSSLLSQRSARTVRTPPPHKIRPRVAFRSRHVSQPGSPPPPASFSEGQDPA